MSILSSTRRTLLPLLLDPPTATTTTITTPHTRQFHSHNHPPLNPFTPSESTILTHALRHVPEHGFSTTSLTLGARQSGYLDISTNLFPRGAFDLINFHLTQQRLSLSQKIQFNDTNNQGATTSQKIRALCIERLKGNTEIIHRWQEALAIMSHPTHLPTSLAELSRLSDEIWYLAGDTSVDTTWYTKRATLSAIYASTELFMTQDTSPDFEYTWDFLDRRLQDVHSLGKLSSELAMYLGYQGHAIANILRSKNFRFPGL